MKKNLLFLMSLFTMTLISSCSQDETIGELDNSLLAQVENVSELNDLSLTQKEMTYEQYLKGYTLDELSTPKDELTPTTTPETVADAKLIQLLKDSLDNTYSKTSVSTKATNYYAFYGVFKVNTCGNFSEVKIFMDCEDGGWTNVENNSLLPGTWVDGNRNIGMTFCVVGTDRTEFIAKNAHAALYFGGATLISNNANSLLQSGHIEFVERYHDNDDKNNKNGIDITWRGDHKLDFNYLTEIYQSAVPRPTYQDKNTLLTWIVNYGVPKTSFKPGFAYGLLNFHPYPASGQVVLNIDDENGSNANYCNLVQWHDKEGWVRNQDFNPRVYKNLDLLYNTKYLVEIINP